MAGPRKKAPRTAPALKVLGASPDGDALLLGRTSSAVTPAFRLALDEDLVEALEQAQSARQAATRARDQLELPPPIPARVESTLSVREIQNLLRQGRTAEAIAKKAGVDPAWVQRWEGPIVWERAGMATRARRAFMTRPRGGPSRLALGEAVAANLAERGIKPDPEAQGDGWDSIKRPRSERWIVTLTFTARGREQHAHWEYDPEADTIVANDKLAGELGWIAPIKRRSRA